MNKVKKHFSNKINKISKDILKYIIELSIVAFGVFLGMYVGERNSQQKTELNTRNALTQIKSELNSNADRLKSAISYHEQIGKELDSLTKSLKQNDYNSVYFNNEKFNFNNLPTWKGIGVVRLSKTIYESAKIGGIFQELNISTINLISSLYEYQDIYNDISETTIDKMLAMNSETKTSDVIQILNRLSKYDIILTEKRLLKKIKTSVPKLEKIIKDKSYKK